MGTDTVQCVPVAKVTGPLRAVVMSQQRGNPALGLPHDLNRSAALFYHKYTRQSSVTMAAKIDSSGFKQCGQVQNDSSNMGHTSINHQKRWR